MTVEVKDLTKAVNSRAGLSLSDARGTDSGGASCQRKQNCMWGLTSEIFNYLSCKWYKLSNSETHFVNEIEQYVAVNYLLCAHTRFASAGNGYLKREPGVAFTMFNSIRDTIKPNYPDQSSKTYSVYIVRLYLH